LLRVERLQTAYGASQVLFDLSLEISEGELTTLLGRNGMGKTTAVRSIMGLTRANAGAISFRGRRIEREAPDRIARQGIALVPEGRQIFPNLSVREHLVAFAANRSGRADPWDCGKVFDLFPRLRDRADNLGSQLSGGEQQMLAVARALMGSPDVLMLDEPLEGLAPVIVDALMKAMRELRDAGGMTLLLVEQHARLALEFAPRAIVLVRGRIAYDGPSQTLLDDHDRLHQLIGVAGDTRPVIPAEETTTLETIA
jgi:branched-chain amino acid transport system ATP-binding protein